MATICGRRMGPDPYSSLAIQLNANEKLAEIKIKIKKNAKCTSFELLLLSIKRVHDNPAMDVHFNIINIIL